MDQNKLLSKKHLRELMIASRNKLRQEDISKKSKSIFDSLEKLFQFNNAENIMIYWPIKNEVDTIPLIDKWYQKKKLYLPFVDGADNMHACLYTGPENLINTGKYQIPEPVDKTTYPPENLDLIIVPGVAFAKNKYRLGFGKGYYDRFLANRKAFKIGVCFSFQVVDKLENDEWDIPMDLILTNEN